MVEIRSKPLLYVMAWVALMFNVMFFVVVIGGYPLTGDAPRYEFRRTCMGSEITILIYSDDPALAKRAADAAFDRVQSLDKVLSDYDPESELMRLCDHAGGPPVKVSDDLLRVLKTAIDWAERSDGAFDPTIGPLVRQWRRARRERKLPNPENLATARKLVGWRKLHLDEATHAARLDLPGMRLDLGGIAKGDAAQEALKVLREHKITHALVAAAGDIAAGEPPPGSEGWRVELRPLGPADPSPPHVVHLVNQAASTSGDAERYVEIDGVRYSHIVDPRTGLCLTERSGVSVLAADGASADALATACAVLGAEPGLKLVESTPGASAIFAGWEGQNVEIRRSTRLPPKMKD